MPSPPPDGPPGGRPWSAAEERRLADLARGGATRAEIGAALGRTKLAVGRKLERLRLRLKDPGRWASFADADAQRNLAFVRGVFIDRLDGRLNAIVEAVGRACGDDLPGPRDRLNLAVRVVQEVQLALFPEEFADDPEAAAAIAGLVPPRGEGLNRVGVERFRAFARVLTGGPPARGEG